LAIATKDVAKTQPPPATTTSPNDESGAITSQPPYAAVSLSVAAVLFAFGLYLLLSGSSRTLVTD
jgi:hypothetical protein